MDKNHYDKTTQHKTIHIKRQKILNLNAETKKKNTSKSFTPDLLDSCSQI